MPSALIRGVAATGSNITGLNATLAYSVVLWIKPGSLENPPITGDILRHTSTASASRDGIGIWFQNGAATVRIGASASNADSSCPAATMQLAQNKWQHLAFVFSDSDNAVSFYKDGRHLLTVVNAGAITSNASCTTNILGTDYQALLSGMVFDYQLFPDYALSAQEIKLLMNPGFNLGRAGGRYFGRGYAQSTTVRDETGGGNNLTNSAVNVYQGPTPPFNPALV